MELAVNIKHADVDPVEWARRREDQGWDVLSVTDHFIARGQPFPHVWVTASAVATATTRPRIMTAFVNNLLRSPVEVAQAALMMQTVSEGRFELGLGAGWTRDEIVGAGMDYLEPRHRAGSLIEAVQIVRSLLHTGACSFEGDYHRIAIDGLGPMSADPPTIVASVGGPRTVRHVTPHCDRVEIKASSPGTRGGSFDADATARIPDRHLIEMIERVRAVDRDIRIDLFVLCNAGNDQYTRELSEQMGDGLFGRFFGPVTKVVEGIAWLDELGISRCQLSAFDDASIDRLAPALYA